MAEESRPEVRQPHWLRRLGAIPLALLAIRETWRFLRWVVDLLGDLQTVLEARDWLPEEWPDLPELPAMTFPVWLDPPNWLVLIGVVLVLVDFWRTRAVVQAGRPRVGAGPKVIRLRCVEPDPPFMPGDKATFGPTEIAPRIESGRWEPIPPSRREMFRKHALAFFRLAPAPEPSLGFRADERPGTDLFVRVTNYGAKARVSAWATCMGTFGREGKEDFTPYPVLWRESGSQIITLRTGQSATLHVIRVTRVPKPPNDPEPRLTDWQVITALGADGRDTDRQFYSHVKDWNEGVVWFAVVLECPTNPITRPPATAHYVVENTRDGKAARLLYKGFSRIH